jgi:uncharacterized protein (TIGR02611 family)
VPLLRHGARLRLKKPAHLLAAVRAFVHRWPGGPQAWRIGVAVLGLVVVLAGAVMLVLPGPGWLVIFLGIGIWATEFAWAHSLLQVVRRHVARWTAWAGGRPRWLWFVVGAACLVVVTVVAWLAST